MNICFLSKTFHQARGGIETDIYNLAKVFTANGHTVHLITSAEKSFYNRDINSYGVIIHQLDHTYEPFKGSWRVDRLVPFLDARYSRAIAAKINRLIASYPIDIVQAPDWLCEGLHFSLNSRKIPLVVRLHGHISIYKYYLEHSLPRNIHYHIRWQQEKKMVLHANGITANSEFYIRFMEKNWNIIFQNVEIIPNTVDTDIFHPSNKPILSPKRVLYVGRLEKNKGVGILAQAIPLVHRECPDTEFIFVGSDTKEEGMRVSWKEHLSKLLQGRKVRFLEPVEAIALAKLYQESTVCVVPSLFETFATVALEAMACAKPVVVTNVGGFPEVVKDNFNGLIVPANDVYALATALCRLLKDDQLRVSLGQNARKTIESAFTLDKVYKKTLIFYQKAIERFTAGCSQ